uniref:PDZ domain-containing protein n=1 Tax=Setaria digitata TaxID=48799 RepID=A0A915Q033_9BILA
MRKQIILRRSAPTERLGLGIAIESDDSDNRIEFWERGRFTGMCQFFRVISVRVEQLDPCSIASRSGLQLGDRVWTVAGNDVHQCTRAECLSLLQQPAMTVTMVVTRQNVTPSSQNKNNRCSTTNGFEISLLQKETRRLNFDCLSAKEMEVPKLFFLARPNSDQTDYRYL